MSNIHLSDFKVEIMAALRWLLPATWQQAVASVGLTVAIALGRSGIWWSAFGGAIILFPVAWRGLVRLGLSRYARSNRLGEEIDSAAYGQTYHRVYLVSGADELIVLNVEATSGMGKLPVEVVIYRRHGGIWMRKAVAKVETQVERLIGPERNWDRLTAFVTSWARSYVYVLTPSFGNRFRNRSAYVELYPLEEKAEPIKFSFESYDAAPELWTGLFKVPEDKNVPESVKRAVVARVAAAGFTQRLASPDEIAARQWQAKFGGVDDATLTGGWFGRYPCGEPYVVIEGFRYFGAWRDDPIFEIRGDDLARVVKIANGWPTLATLDGLLVICDGDGLWAYDPKTRRLWKLRGDFGTLEHRDGDLRFAPTGQPSESVRELITMSIRGDAKRASRAPENPAATQ